MPWLAYFKAFLFFEVGLW